MRAITCYQPWASLIAEGVKTIETRPMFSPWHTAVGETIAIHAAKRAAEAMQMGDWYCGTSRGSAAEWRLRRATFGTLTGCTTTQESHALPLGAVVAMATLVDVVPMVDAWPRPRTGPVDCCYVGGRYPLTIWSQGDHRGVEVMDQRPFGDFAPGRWALLLDNVIRLDPIPCRGRQGLWTVPTDVGLDVVGQIDRIVTEAIG